MGYDYIKCLLTCQILPCFSLDVDRAVFGWLFGRLLNAKLLDGKGVL